MPSVFTRIINGELPGRFVWTDDHCVALLAAAPLRPGHTLVVPRDEVDHWIDLPPELASHLMLVAQKVGRAIQSAFQPAKVGIAVVGLEVRHVHIHLVPIDSIGDMDFSRQDRAPDPAMMDSAAERLREALGKLAL